MQLLSLSSIPSPWVRRLSRPLSTPVPQLSRRRPLDKSWTQVRGHVDKKSFEQLGLPISILLALQRAFPSIEQPTAVQYQFLTAIRNGDDVLLRDQTGSGKSLAAALALLSKRRGNSYKDATTGKVLRPITSLLLVPHRDLAYQYLHWVGRIHDHMEGNARLPSLAQVLIRDSSMSLTERLAQIQQTPPHILIGTPQAVLDVVRSDPHALPLDRLSTVVVDEVDYLVDSVPIMADKREMMSLERKIRRHPGATRLLLDHIYSAKNTCRKNSDQMLRVKNPSGHSNRRGDERAFPQLVTMSATLRNHLKRFLVADSGWFTGDSRKFIRICGAASAKYPESLVPTTDGPEDKAAFSVGGTDITHHVLVYAQDGSVTNIDGAISAPEDRSAKPQEVEQRAEEVQETALPPELTQEPAEEEFEGPSPFDATALETIGAAFALDVPSVALLVLRSDAPVLRAVKELRMLGVNARPLDVVKDENGRTHLMRRDFDSTAENPTLLVSTLASTRGLDLPELSHVFILGILDEGAVDSYLHVAGRVGRFGRGGKVISVVGGVADRHKTTGRVLKRDEGRVMDTMLKKMGIRPVMLEHFVSSGDGSESQ